MTPETLGPFTCIGGIPTERMNRAQPILDRHGVHVVEVAIGYKLECPNADAATAVKADLRKAGLWHLHKTIPEPNPWRSQ